MFEPEAPFVASQLSFFCRFVPLFQVSYLAGVCPSVKSVRTTWKLGEIIVCWYLQGKQIIPGFLRWCRISSIHSSEDNNA